MYYSVFYQNDNLMDCDSSGGCDGSGCNHSDCSNYNYCAVDLLFHNAQETKYVHVSYHCTCNYNIHVFLYKLTLL